METRFYVWEVLDVAVKAWGGGMRLSERLRRVVCVYCGTANEVGKSRCVACGAPLGIVQPRTCPHCGFVVQAEGTVCPNCGQKLT